MLEIDYKYIFFWGIIFLFSILDKKKVEIFIIGLFIIFLGFSEIGPDYFAYKGIYENVAKDFYYSNCEYLYKKINIFFYNLGIPYEIYRALYLTTLISVFIYYLKKLSLNLSFSLLIFYSIYLTYIVSANRQFFMMVSVIAGIYYILKKKEKIAYIIASLAVFIHTSGILMILFLFLNKKLKKVKRKNYIYIFLWALVIRWLISYNKDILIIISTIVGAKEKYLPYVDTLNFFGGVGFFSRVIPWLMLEKIYYKRINENKQIKWLYMIYTFSIIGYVSIPSELVAGRLFNNFKFLEIIIIPYIARKRTSKIVFLGYSFIIFIWQLLNQVGYYPYLNFISKLF